MARGITELDVHQAADELLGTGDRPTVEKVRARLGTGSPNTVTRWLDTWWKALGARLHDQAAITALPGVPEQVASLAQRCWREALAASADYANSQVATERRALEHERQTLADERSIYENHAIELQRAANDAALAQSRAEAGQAELRDQLARATSVADDFLQQRDAIAKRATRVEEQLASAQRALAATREAADKERVELNDHIRAVEDRAYREIDLLRQQLAASDRERAAADKRHAKESAAQRDALQTARQAVTVATAEAKLQAAMADAAAQQLAALQMLPAEMAELRKLVNQRSASGSGRRPSRRVQPGQNPAIKAKPSGKGAVKRVRDAKVGDK